MTFRWQYFLSFCFTFFRNYIKIWPTLLIWISILIYTHTGKKVRKNECNKKKSNLLCKEHRQHHLWGFVWEVSEEENLVRRLLWYSYATCTMNRWWLVEETRSWWHHTCPCPCFRWKSHTMSDFAGNNTINVAWCNNQPQRATCHLRSQKFQQITGFQETPASLRVQGCYHH